jgi:hypothetical protein
MLLYESGWPSAGMMRRGCRGESWDTGWRNTAIMRASARGFYRLFSRSSGIKDGQ